MVMSETSERSALLIINQKRTGVLETRDRDPTTAGKVILMYYGDTQSAGVKYSSNTVCTANS